MDKKYGIVLVGCGYMGASHLEDIYFRDNIEIRCVVNINANRAQAFMKRYSASSWSIDYTADEVFEVFKIALAADQAVKTGVCVRL